jgi:uncharacterized protein
LDSFFFIVGLIFIGASAGVLAGLLGVGGGLIIVPGLFYLFTKIGYDLPYLIQVCVATSITTIIFTSLRSLQSHHRKKAVDWLLLKRWSVALVIGGTLGAVVADQLKGQTMMIIFGTLTLLLAAQMAFGRPHHLISKNLPSLPARTGWGIATGFFSAIMGIGGGTFGVSILTLYNMTIHRAVGTASGFGAIIALPAALIFMLTGNDLPDRPLYNLGYVNLLAFGVITVMTFLFAPLGVKLAHKMNPKPLRLVFAIFLLVVGLNMLRKAVWG